MREEWKDKMKQTLEGFQMEAPDGLWDDINRRMASELAMGNATVKRQNRMRIIAIRSLAAAACAAGLAGIFFTLNDGGNEGRRIARSVAPASSAVSPATEADKGAEASEKDGSAEPTPTVKDNGRLLAHSTAMPHTTIHAAAPAGSGESTGTADSGMNEEAAEESATAHQTERREERSEEKVMSRAMAKTTANSSDLLMETYPTVTSTGGSDDKFTLSLYAMNSGSNSSSLGNSPSPFMTDGIMYCDDEEEEEPTSIMRHMYSRSVPAEKVKHHAPLRAGVSVRYALTDKLGIETGLTYSYLSSDFTIGESGNGCKTEQKLHFVGIPVNVDYSLWSNKLFNIYVSGGMMAEVNVKGRTTATTELDNKVVDTEEEDIRMKRMQWSVNAAAGAQLNIYKGIGLYVEPGVGYYIDNGSEIKTAYTDKPFNFNFKLGLRYSIK